MNRLGSSFNSCFHCSAVRLCGNQLPTDPVISTGSRMLLTYKTSEHSVHHTGFIAVYEGKLFKQGDQKWPFSNVTGGTKNPSDLSSFLFFSNELFLSEAVCGGELNMESGQLESPNYPEDYVPNKECIWVITVPLGFQVALKFQSFEVSRD